MEFKFPENPHIYWILIGAFLIIADLKLVNKYGLNGWLNYLVAILGSLLIIIGVTRLEVGQDLKHKKLKAEIKVLEMEAKIKERESNRVMVLGKPLR